LWPSPGDVADNFVAGGQANLGDLTKSRVRLFRGRCVNARANAANLRVAFQSLILFGLHRLFATFGARLTDQLLYGWHICPLLFSNVGPRFLSKTTHKLQVISDGKRQENEKRTEIRPFWYDRAPMISVLKRARASF
jgi:hypothetical protein